MVTVFGRKQVINTVLISLKRFEEPSLKVWIGNWRAWASEDSTCVNLWDCSSYKSPQVKRAKRSFDYRGVRSSKLQASGFGVRITKMHFLLLLPSLSGFSNSDAEGGWYIYLCNQFTWCKRLSPHHLHNFTVHSIEHVRRLPLVVAWLSKWLNVIPLTSD